MLSKDTADDCGEDWEDVGVFIIFVELDVPLECMYLM